MTVGCHESNSYVPEELDGVLMAMGLIKKDPKFSYRFIIAPDEFWSREHDRNWQAIIRVVEEWKSSSSKVDVEGEKV